LTVQGEGPSSGRLCAFLRLGGCNLSCNWCDTPYTWDWTGRGRTGIAHRPERELHPTSAGDVLDRLLAYDVPLVVITGGEPLSQQRRLVPVVAGLVAAGRRVEFETNGTVAPIADLRLPGVRYNVSPKLSHSGDPEGRRIVPAALLALGATPDVAFKFVCRTERDLDEVGALVDRFRLSPVWIMPEGTAEATVVRGLR
jgi:organic radical activating enzyme